MGYVFGGAEARRFPLATVALVIVNVVVYVLTSSANGFLSTSQAYVYRLGYIPALLTSAEGALRMLTSMFVHADILHILFNMYFLYIFGRGVEDLVGRRRFLLLYLLSGIGAALFHTAAAPISGVEAIAIPAVGASGAISGVLGAYMMFFPRTSLVACFPVFFLPACFTVRAAAYLAFWFVLQVVYGYMRLGGVAYFAHAGGFIVGIALAWLLGSDRVYAARAYTYVLSFFRYIVFRVRGEGLGGATKLVLVMLITATAVTMSYYSATTRVDLVSVYQLTAWVDGYGDTTFLRVSPDGSYDYVEPQIEYVSLVLLRLSRANVLVNPSLAGEQLDTLQEPLRVTVPIRLQVYGTYISEDVPVVLQVRATYDERGVVRLAEGRMYTEVVEVRVTYGRVVTRRVPSTFELSLTATGPYTGESVRVAVLPSVLASLVSAYVVARKDVELSVA